MSTSLSCFVDNLSDKIHNDDKCANCSLYLEYISTKNSKLLFECLDCKKRYSRKFTEKLETKLTTKFKNGYKFCKGDINKFVLLLRKGVYPYEYMDDWSKFDKEELPDKSHFYSSFHREEISSID